ncbi:MAG: alpha-amylase, partial [Candidatus Marinimicrobia bacterium CG_4_10_14_0_2_um_filter_48_9]
EWYTHNASGEIISPNADWYDVADLDYNQSGLRDYMIEMLQWWITE